MTSDINVGLLVVATTEVRTIVATWTIITTRAVIDETLRRAEDRRHVLFFCCGIDHAEHVRDILREKGETAEAGSSRCSAEERDRIINAFKAFSEALIITDGGPLNSTMLFALYIYKQGFSYFKMGYAYAMSWVLLVIISIFSIFVFKSSDSWVHYES